MTNHVPVRDVSRTRDLCAAVAQVLKQRVDTELSVDQIVDEFLDPRLGDSPMAAVFWAIRRAEGGFRRFASERA